MTWWCFPVVVNKTADKQVNALPTVSISFAVSLHTICQQSVGFKSLSLICITNILKFFPQPIRKINYNMKKYLYKIKSESGWLPRRSFCISNKKIYILKHYFWFFALSYVLFNYTKHCENNGCWLLLSFWFLKLFI